MKKSTCFVIALILMLGSVITCRAQKTYGQDKLQYSGTYFWFSNPPGFADQGDCDVYIYVNSMYKTDVIFSVEYGNREEKKHIEPNKTVVFELSDKEGIVKTKESQEEPFPEQVYSGKGIQLFSERPVKVVCAVICEHQGTAFKVHPVSALGKNYIVAAYNEDPMFQAIWNLHFPSQTTITAPYERTKVSFTLGGNGYTETAGGMTPGNTKYATLNAGDVWMIMTKGENSDLSGSVISADKPVAVVAGNQSANIPAGNQWSNYISNMLIPVNSWGTHYHVPAIPDRKNPSIIRVFAKEEDTKIFRDGRQVSTIPNVGGIQTKGFQEMRMHPEEMEPHPVVISGDKPIGVTFYNTGAQEDGYPRHTSDPFMMPLKPQKSYSYELILSQPEATGDNHFNQNYLHLIYESDDSGSVSDDIKYAEDDDKNWVKLKDKFPGKGVPFDYDINGKKYAVKTLTINSVESIRLKADRPIGVYSFGYGSGGSYGFPCNDNYVDIPASDTLPPDPYWEMDCAGNVNTDSAIFVEDMPKELGFRANLALIKLHSDSSFNYELSYDDFHPGVDPKTKWQMEIIDPAKDARALISFVDRHGNDTTINIVYHGIKLKMEPDNHNFGIVKKGDTVTKEFMIINESEHSIAHIEPSGVKNVPYSHDGVQLKRKGQNFSVEFEDPYQLPYQLMPLDTFKFDVKFKAVESGEFYDSVGVGDTCLFWYKAQVETRVGMPVIKASDYDFGILYISQDTTHEFTISNVGDAPLTITGYDDSNVDPVYTHTLEQINFPKELGTGEDDSSFTYEITFEPSEQKEYNSQIYIISDTDKEDPRTDSVVMVNGKGQIPGAAGDLPAIGKSVTLSPNPADDNFALGIELPEPAEIAVSISDIQGRLIYVPFRSKYLPAGESCLNIDSGRLRSGAYIVTIEVPGGKINKKLTVVR